MVDDHSKVMLHCSVRMNDTIEIDTIEILLLEFFVAVGALNTASVLECFPLPLICSRRVAILNLFAKRITIVLNLFPNHNPCYVFGSPASSLNSVLNSPSRNDIFFQI